MSTVYRGLQTALELKNAGDDVVVQFDGAGVESLAGISSKDSPMNSRAVALADGYQILTF